MEAFTPVRLPAGRIAREVAERGEFAEGGQVFTDADIPLAHLYAGLAVVSRDLVEHLRSAPRDDAVLFDRVVGAVAQEEGRRFGARGFPRYDGLPVDALPTGLVGADDLSPLADPGIVHEYTSWPGKLLFLRFTAEFRDALCGQDGLDQQLRRGTLGAAELTSALVLTMMKTGFSLAAPWVPLCAFLAVLIVRTGLSAFCGTPPSPRTELTRTASRSRR